MWICAKCGTQAQQIEVCSGCGTLMRLPNQPPKEKQYQYVLVIYSEPNVADVVGPFESVMGGDSWAEANLTHSNYEVMLMENPNDREA
jgi:hypothetical protein